MENEKYIVDRFEKPWYICERQKDKKMFDIYYTFFEKEVSDGDVVIFKNGKYIKDDISKNEREKRILEKFKRLKGEC